SPIYHSFPIFRLISSDNSNAINHLTGLPLTPTLYFRFNLKSICIFQDNLFSISSHKFSHSSIFPLSPSIDPFCPVVSLIFPFTGTRSWRGAGEDSRISSRISWYCCFLSSYHSNHSATT